MRIGTKLNRSDLVTGRQSLILPCLGRTEADITPARAGRPPIEQFTSTENSMGVVQWSRGKFAPRSPSLMGETAIICRLAHAVLGDRATVDWRAWADNYDLIRDGIAKVIPGCQDYNQRVRQPGGFYLPNPPREGVFPTPTGKATFTVNPIPDHHLAPDQIALTTVRSHDQFNTTIYGLHNRHRGLFHERRIIMMNRQDMDDRGIARTSVGRDYQPLLRTNPHGGRHHRRGISDSAATARRCTIRRRTYSFPSAAPTR